MDKTPSPAEGSSASYKGPYSNEVLNLIDKLEELRERIIKIDSSMRERDYHGEFERQVMKKASQPENEPLIWNRLSLILKHLRRPVNEEDEGAKRRFAQEVWSAEKNIDTWWAVVKSSEARDIENRNLKIEEDARKIQDKLRQLRSSYFGN